MSINVEAIDALIREIEIAFDGVSREDGITLHESYVIDDYGSPEQQAEARKQDTETRWQDIPEAHLRSSTILSYACAKSFRYYLPAYLIKALKNVKQYIGLSEDEAFHFSYGEDKTHSIIFHLTIYVERKGEIISDSASIEYNLEKFSMLNAAQVQVICRFLHCIATHDDNDYYNGDSNRELALKALQQHWNRVC